MARLRVVLVAALVSGASASRTGALFGKLSGLVGKTKGQIAHVLDGLVVDREYRRELPPYDAVELGVDGGCWPIFTTLASGDAYALRVTGLASQKVQKLSLPVVSRPPIHPSFPEPFPFSL